MSDNVTTNETPAQRVRQLLSRDEVLVAPCVYDAIGAKLVEELGFDCVYVHGFGVAASMGVPDIGLTTMTEVVRQAARIAEAVSVPVMCDVDTGFGGSAHVARTVREFEKAGIAGIKLEDQLTPANRVGRPVVPLDEMTAKLRAAVDARSSDDFCVMARTDAAPTLGLAEAIRRCQAFEEAGADVTHALDIPTEAEMRDFVAALTKPTTGVISLPHPPVLSVAELSSIGFKLILVSVPVLFSAVHAMHSFLCTLTAMAAESAAEGVAE